MTVSCVRTSAVSGLFYPSDANRLRNEIRCLIAQCSGLSVEGRVCGLISPHAGYVYSGLTAAHGYSLLEGKQYDAVVIVSPSHREYFDGVSVYAGDAYQTPFGAVSVNREIKERLADSCSFLEMSLHGHGLEHGVEVQLPFLQEMLPDLSIVPIVIGNQRRDICLELGDALSDIMNEANILAVASTDLSHYHPRAEAEALDRVMIDDIAEFNYGRLLDDLAEGRTEACGGGPVASVLRAMHKTDSCRIKILDYRTSADATGDDREVVGYLSAAMFC